MIKLLIIISVLTLLNLSFPIRVSAQEMIRVSPIILKVKLEPGTTQNYQIKVENLLDTPLPLKASIEGFDASDEEYGVRVTDQPTTSPLMDWISLDEKDAILPAKTERDFNIKIAVPDKVPIGGYYAMIFFTPMFPGVPVNSKIGVLALANIGVLVQKNQADIVTFNFDKALYKKGPIQTTIRVKNTSLNYFTAKPTLTIKPLFGVEKTFELEEKTILPGKIRRWERAFDLGNLYGGIYTATLSVSLENGDYIYSTTRFYGFPATKTLVVALIAAIAVYSLVFRKRVIKALHELIKG